MFIRATILPPTLPFRQRGLSHMVSLSSVIPSYGVMTQMLTYDIPRPSSLRVLTQRHYTTVYLPCRQRGLSRMVSLSSVVPSYSVMTQMLTYGIPHPSSLRVLTQRARGVQTRKDLLSLRQIDGVGSRLCPHTRHRNGVGEGAHHYHPSHTTLLHQLTKLLIFIYLLHQT